MHVFSRWGPSCEGSVFTFLIDLAWKARIHLPVVVTAVLLASNFRIEFDVVFIREEEGGNDGLDFPIAFLFQDDEDASTGEVNSSMYGFSSEYTVSSEDDDGINLYVLNRDFFGGGQNRSNNIAEIQDFVRNGGVNPPRNSIAENHQMISTIRNHYMNLRDGGAGNRSNNLANNSNAVDAPPMDSDAPGSGGNNSASGGGGNNGASGGGGNNGASGSGGNNAAPGGGGNNAAPGGGGDNNGPGGWGNNAGLGGWDDNISSDEDDEDDTEAQRVAAKTKEIIEQLRNFASGTDTVHNPDLIFELRYFGEDEEACTSDAADEDHSNVAESEGNATGNSTNPASNQAAESEVDVSSARNHSGSEAGATAAAAVERITSVQNLSGNQSTDIVAEDEK